MLPNFIVIGAAKAGTTALYWYLLEHPEIYMSPMKETNFLAFGVDADGNLLYGDPRLHTFRVRTLEEYERLFAAADGAKAIGEASPIYLECPQTAERIQRLIPDARLVCGLRNPVDRAYSDYQMYLRARGRRLDPARDLTPDSEWARPDSHWMQLGRYHEQLSRYYQRFAPRQIHIFLFDDLRRSAADVVRELYEFLDVDPGFVPDFDTPHNVGGTPASMGLERVLTSRRIKSIVGRWMPNGAANLARRLRTRNLRPAPPLPEELRGELSGHFREEIRLTSQLIGRDLAAWLN